MTSTFCFRSSFFFQPLTLTLPKLPTSLIRLPYGCRGMVVLSTSSRGVLHAFQLASQVCPSGLLHRSFLCRAISPRAGRRTAILRHSRRQGCPCLRTTRRERHHCYFSRSHRGRWKRPCHSP